MVLVVGLPNLPGGVVCLKCGNVGVLSSAIQTPRRSLFIRKRGDDRPRISALWWSSVLGDDDLARCQVRRVMCKTHVWDDNVGSGGGHESTNKVRNMRITYKGFDLGLGLRQ